MTRIVINGSKGRMGEALVAGAARLPDVALAGQVDVGDNLGAVLPDSDVVIDFSFHDITPKVAELCVQHQKAIVIGTTGHTPEAKDRITQCSRQVPMVWAANFSTGVNTLFWLTRKAAEILGSAADVEIVEMHHRLKKDAPSGTAMTLADILVQVRQQKADQVLRHGRHGLVGERSPEEIGMHALRGGDVVGEHTVIFALAGERLELSHKAASRQTFASGALRAALWVTGQKPGLYSMEDVLGLK